jgi:hypothetical protein
MILHLHGIGANAETSPIHVGDSLASAPSERFSMVLTNPPFGKKSSVTYANTTCSSREARVRSCGASSSTIGARSAMSGPRPHPATSHQPIDSSRLTLGGHTAFTQCCTEVRI